MLKKIFLIVILNLQLALTMQSAHEKGSVRLDIKNYTTTNNVLLLQDDKISNVNAFVSISTPLGFFDFSYKNRLVLGIDRAITSLGSFSTALLADHEYTAQVIVNLTYNQLTGNIFTNVNVPCTLSVNYKGEITTMSGINNGSKEIDQDVFTYNNGYISLATITSIVIKNSAGTAVSLSTLPNNLYLELQTDAERYYDMTTSAIPFTSNGQAFIRYYSDVTTGNQLEFNWQRIPGAEEYDLEWVWVDEYTYNGTSCNSVAANIYWAAYPVLDFRNNSTRVRTDQNSYKISNTFESGYVFFRVRGVGKTLTPSALTALGNDPLTDYVTPWTWEDNTTLPATFSGFIPTPTSISSIGTTVISGIPVGGGVESALVNTPNTPWFISLTCGVSAALSMEHDKNWVYTATYAEEGKKKEVVSFFDGAQLNRQTVTLSNSDNVAIVAESYYDYLGRSAVHALPTPVDDATIKFYQVTVNSKNGFNFENVGTNPNPFTKDVFALLTSTGCASPDAGFSALYGSGRYYSVNNPFINPSNPFYNVSQINASYVPDGENFPFSRTGYVSDYTGKVARQGGVGPTFKIKNSGLFADMHDTRTMYDVPLQEELDRLFGSEAGYANRYQKVTTIDGNGQASISYYNDNGKVVATALTGTVPANVNALNNSAGSALASSPYVLDTDLLNKTTSSAIDSPNDNNILEGDALIFNQKITVVSAQTYSFNYSLLGVTFAGCTNVCYDCVYDLTFDITDKCGQHPSGFAGPLTYTLGKIVSPGLGALSSSNPDSICGNETVNFSFQQIVASSSSSLAVSLDPGEYTISKKLTVNEQALNTYLDIYVRTCALKLSDFQAAEAAHLDTSGCNMTCAQCVAQLGTLGAYITANAPKTPTTSLSTYQVDSLTAEYNQLVTDCNEPCNYTSYCEAAYETMLVDVCPGGQYADDEGPNNTIDPTQYPLSLLNVNNSLSKQVSAGTPPSWKYPDNLTTSISPHNHYFDDDNVTLSLVQVIPDPVTSVFQPPVVSSTATFAVNNLIYTYPENLTNVSDFISNWKPSWAVSLVKYHPEYCYYQWCQQNSTNTLTAVSVSAYNIDPTTGNYLLTTYSSSFNSSDSYDSLLTSIDDLDGITSGDVSKVMDPLSNDPYWTTTGYYSVVTSGNPASTTASSNLQQLLSTTAATPVDYSATSPALYVPDISNYKSANNRFWNYKGTGLNLYQYAAILSTTLVANFTQNSANLIPLLNPTNAGYATSPSVASPMTYITNFPANSDLKRNAWQHFNTMYLALKQELQSEAAESYVMNSGCRGCNDCIGQSNFNNQSVPFAKYFQYYYWTSWPNNFLSLTNYFNEWYFNYQSNNNQQQQCGITTAGLYAGKTKRFQSTTDAQALDNTSGQNTQANIYATTGLCPNAFYLQNFLNDMADPGSGNSIVSTLNNLQANNSSFNADLYKIFNGGVLGTSQANYVFGSASGLALSAAVNISPNSCALTLNFPSSLPSGYPSGINDWSNYQGSPSYKVVGFYDLVATGANAFSIVAKIWTTASVPTQYTLTLTGTTCTNFNLTNCSFLPPCALNGNGETLRDMFSALATNNQFVTSSPVTLGGSSSTAGAPYNTMFNNGLKPFLEITNVNSTTWTWSNLTSSSFLIDDGSSVSSGNNKIKITFNIITPSSGFNLACVNSFQNFRVDPDNPNGGFIVEANIINASVASGCTNGTYVITGIAEIGMNPSSGMVAFNMGTCNFQLSTCNSAEHQVERDVEAFVLSSGGTDFGNMINGLSLNLTSDALFTTLLRSYIGNAYAITSGPSVPQNYYYWVKDVTNTTAMDVVGWYIRTSTNAVPTALSPNNACNFDLKFKDGQTGLPSSILGFSSLADFTVVANPLVNNNAYSFEVNASYSSGTFTLVGTTSCFPMRACDVCTTTTSFAASSSGSHFVIQDFSNPGNYTLQRGTSNYSYQGIIPTTGSIFIDDLQSCVMLTLSSSNYLYWNTYAPFSCSYSGYGVPGLTAGNCLGFNAVGNCASNIPESTPTKYTQFFSPPFNSSYNLNFGINSVPTTPNAHYDINYKVYDNFNNLLLNTTAAGLSGANAFSSSALNLYQSISYKLEITLTNNQINNGMALTTIQLQQAGTGESTLLPCTQTTWPTDTMPTVQYEEPCAPYLKDLIENEADVKYNQYIDSVKTDFIVRYKRYCMQNAVENLFMKYNNTDYHFTLYYYDQAGNLVRTVPPEGVKLILPGINGYPTSVLQTVKSERDAYPATKTIFSSHLLYTTYTYNSLNQLVKQNTPDAGLSLFYYDLLGRLSLSQNAEQLAQGIANSDNEYSYTVYDPLGRINEVGKLTASADLAATYGTGLPAALSNAIYPANMPGAGRYEVTKTYYGDQTGFVPIVSSAVFSNGMQQNLRTRVASVSIEDIWDGNDLTYNHATHYTYDVHGNVKELIQDNFDITTTPFPTQRYKRIQYQYDLISGKVNQVDYQLNQIDMLSHKYRYDANNRITNVHTSRDGYSWDQDAKYYYYLHGPLARAEIGQHKVQGIDYAYTLQGWIKGVNSNMVSAANDMGKDSYANIGNPSTTNYIHNYAASDAFGYNLNYYAYYDGTSFTEDYKPVNSSIYSSTATYFLSQLPNLGATNVTSLYNGNISTMGTAFLNIDPTLSTLPNTAQAIGKYQNYSQLKQFKYDQLNRINDAVSNCNYISPTGNNWNLISSATQYHEKFTYDEDGNIMTNKRNNATQSSSPTMDDLQYYYYTQSGSTYIPGASSPADATNKLAYVTDALGAPIGDDIGNQSANNYTYDNIGNLESDAAEGITQVDWTVYGKIKDILRTSTSTSRPIIKFKYDAMGNRISKALSIITRGGLLNYQTTYYTRDAQGNIMGTYVMDYLTLNPDVTCTLQELNLYGSSRLGNIDCNLLIGTTVASAPPIANVPPHNRELGDKQYELGNHLGNVLTVVSDRKIAMDYGVYNSSGVLTSSTPDGSVDNFVPDVLNTTDYYAFGNPMPGRNVNAGSYRYGFNGKENDNEVKGNGNSQDYGARIYDPRIGKWLSLDPSARKYPDWSPYKAFRDNPIIFQDPDGRDEFLSIIVRINGKVVGIGKAVQTSSDVYTDNVNHQIGGEAYYNRKEWFDKSVVLVRDYDENGKLIGETKSETLMKDKVRATSTGPLIDSQSWATAKSNLFKSDEMLSERMQKLTEAIEEEYGGGGANKEKAAPTHGKDANIILFGMGEIGDPAMNDENYYPNVDKDRATTKEHKKLRKEGDTVINVYGDGEGNSWYGTATMNKDGTSSSVKKANKGQVDRHGEKEK